MCARWFLAFWRKQDGVNTTQILKKSEKPSVREIQKSLKPPDLSDCHLCFQDLKLNLPDAKAAEPRPDFAFAYPANAE